MTDEQTTGGTGESDGIVFDPPSLFTEEDKIVPSDTPANAPTEAVPDTIAEDVGLKLNPLSHPKKGSNSDISTLLQATKLPARRLDATTAQKKAIPLTPSHAPFGAVADSMPQYVPATPPAALRREQEPPIDMVLSAAAEAISEATATPEFPAPETPSPVVSLHTMKGDLQDAVKRDHISTVRAAAMEAQKRAETQAPPAVAPVIARKSHRTLFLTVSIFVFLSLGSAALYAAYFVTTQTRSPAAHSSSILFAEQQTALPLDGKRADELKQSLATMTLSQGNGNGSILQIIPVISDTGTTQTRAATLQEFLYAIGVHPPDELLRALSSQFFFGIHATDIPSPVFVIPVISYDHAFAGMLSWEPDIDGQLAPLFKQVSPYLPAVSTSSMPVARTFEDAVMRNYDVRVLKDDTGSVVLYYSFPNPNILIIAASPNTFPEVLSRLQAQRRL